jgi:hypothetical protein
VKPDVLLSTHTWEVEKLLGALGYRIPGQIGSVSLTLSAARKESGMAGVAADFVANGERAVELLQGMLHRHERGVPMQPMTTSLQELWMEGPSVRGGLVDCGAI